MTSPATNSSPVEKRRGRKKRPRPAAASGAKIANAPGSRRAPAGGISRSSAHRMDCGRATLRRVLFIHERLGNGHRIDAVAVARSLEVSPRTVKRDLEFMRELGAPIEWDASGHSYVYSRECDLLPLLRLDAAEALALLVARDAFAAWGGSALGRALTAALGKIAGVIGGAISLPASEISQFIFQPDSAAETANEQRFFAVALEAIRRRRVLRLDYQKPADATAQTRLVQPLHLAYLDHRWVLVAYDPARHAPRNFLLIRMRAAVATAATFAPPAGFDLAKYLRGSLGRFTGEKEFDVQLAFDADLASYLREHPWHPSQTLAERPDGRLECTLRLNNLIDVRRRILACGAKAEVLAPLELRDSLRSEIAAMTARYAADKL